MSQPSSRWDVAAICVAIIVAASLVLPSVYAAREDAARAQCQNNLRQMGEAVAAFESAQGGLPPRRSGFNNGEPYGGWGSAILPYLNVDTEVLKFDPKFDYFEPKNRQTSESLVTFFVCPASPRDRKIAIQSQVTTKSANPDKDTVFAAHCGVNDYIASNGVLITRSGYGLNALNLDVGGIGNTRQPMADNVTTSLRKITDGLSMTLLLIEQAGRPTVWRNNQVKEGGGQFGLSPNARGAWAGWGSIGFSAADSTTGETPGRGDATDCTVNCNNWFGIYGFHPEGANVLMCDGSVRFIRVGLDPITFAYLTICDDGHVLSENDF